MKTNTRIVVALAFGEIIVWAAFFYLFPAFLAEWERDLGWSKTELSGALTLSLVTSALAAPIAGRLIDRDQSRMLLVGSALAGGFLLALLSLVTIHWQFYLIWFALGLVMAGCLYEPCFAHVTRYFGTDARRAITTIALIAGLAGTVSFPSASILIGLLGWRDALLVFAAAAIFIGAPLMWIGAAPRTDQAPQSSPSQTSQPNTMGVMQDTDPAPQTNVLHTPVFWLIALAYAMIALDHGLLITHLLPLLAERDIHPEAAILAAAMIGPMQVTGRLVVMVSERWLSLVSVFTGLYLFMAAACVALFGAAAAPALLAGFVFFHGAGYGISSIIRPVVTAEFFGRTGFGAISGMLATPYTSMFAAAPTIAALLWELGGYDLVIVVGFTSCLIGLAAFWLALHLRSR